VAFATLEQQAKALGLKMERDGTSPTGRYRFYRAEEPDDPAIGVIVGRTTAWEWLEGFEAGLKVGRERKEQATCT